MSNITFDIKCIQANPQSGICDLSPFSSSSGGSVISATVRGGTDPLNQVFQTIPPVIATHVIFPVVVTDPNLLWDNLNSRFTIPTTGNYFLSFSLCTTNTLTGITDFNNQIFELGAAFQILNADGSVRTAFGKTVVYGGISPTINSINGTSNLTDALSLTSSIILPFTTGEHVQLVTIFVVSNNPGASLDLLDPVVNPGISPNSIGASWFSIAKV